MLFSELKKYRNCMFFVDKGNSNKGIESYKLIDGAAVFSKTPLNICFQMDPFLIEKKLLSRYVSCLSFIIVSPDSLCCLLVTKLEPITSFFALLCTC